MSEKSSMQEVINFDNNEAQKTNKSLDDYRSVNKNDKRSNNEIVSEISDDIDREFELFERMQIKDARARIKKFDMIDTLSKNQSNISEETVEILKNMPVFTSVNKEFFALQKILASLKIKEYVKNTKLSEEPLYYLGASADYHFPLAMGCKNIKMVDPAYGEEDQNIIEKMEKDLSKYDNFQFKKESENIIFEFDFDFGNGEKEKVTISLIADSSDNLQCDESIGGAISYLTGSITSKNEEIYKNLSIGGIMYDGQTELDDAFYMIALQQAQDENPDIDEITGYHEIQKLAQDKVKEIAQIFGFEQVNIDGTREFFYIKKRESEAWSKLLKKGE